MNKNKKIIISLIVTIIMLWLIIFCVDFMRCASFNMPIFVIPSETTADDGGSGTYYGLGYRIEVVKNISAEYGVLLEKIEMYIGNKFVTGAIANYNYHNYSIDEETETSSTTPIEELPKDLTRDRFSNEADRTYSYATFSKIIIDESNNGLKVSLDESIEGSIQSIIVSGEYDIYYYGLESVKIEVDNTEMELQEALSSNKVTMEEIIQQAKNDSENEIIYSDMYKDGGTMEYYYDTYKIIKSNSLDGNRDVYIGIPEMKLSEVR